MACNKLTLSRIFLALSSLSVQSDLSNLFELHERIKTAYQHCPYHENSTFLYRIENQTPPISGEISILVQSYSTPNWDEINRIDGYFSRKPITKNIDNFVVRNNSTYHFILHADPSRRSSDNTKRIGICHENELIQWIHYKGIKYGFSVDEDNLAIEILPPIESIQRKKGEEDSKIIINYIYYSGLLKVTNSQLLIQALYNGVGPGKIYGCGLLSLFS